MTVTAKVLVTSKFLENAQTTQYTAVNVSTFIDSAILYNGSAGAVTFAVNLVNSGGTAGTSNIFVSKSLAAGAYYNIPEITGQLLRSGDFISMIAGTASALTLRITGREVA